MTILEFIRKNSILVLVVIVAVGAGLLMMDYSGKGSAFSRDFLIRVNGANFSQAETVNLGENGREYLSSIFSATRQMFNHFDANDDGVFSDDEQAALNTWLREHQDVSAFYGLINDVYASWHYGVSSDDFVNVAVVRAMLKAEADNLGLHPSEAQIDAYLRAMPPFRREDGSFNTSLYRQITGYREGATNRVQEENFRDVVADIMIWEALQAILTNGVSYNAKAQIAMINAFSQNVSGRSAWLAAEKVPTPAEPTEDELKAYWEANKEAYLSQERRIVSIYTLEPTQDSNMENLLSTTDMLIQDLAQANGRGLDKMLADAQDNPEFDPFLYATQDGSTHCTYPLATQDELSEALRDVVNYNGKDTPLAQVAFSELSDAPTPEQYEALKAAGKPEDHLTFRQIRGFYTSTDDKLKLIRIEAVEPPAVLPYEEARDMALEDLKAERAANALAEAAQKLYDDMQQTAADQGMQAAFDLAASRGATVENYGPVDLAMGANDLPDGVSDADILGTPSGKLTPLVVLADGARITSVNQRTVVDSPAVSMQRSLITLPRENSRLRYSMLQEWLNSAFTRFNVEFSESARMRTDKSE